MEFVAKWLNDNQPKESGRAIIHNDFKYDNAVLDINDPSKVISVLDWEMATLGDPLMDQGTNLGYWVDKHAAQELKLFQLRAEKLDGSPARHDIVTRYEKKSGNTSDNPGVCTDDGIMQIEIITQKDYQHHQKPVIYYANTKGLNYISYVVAIKCW